MLQAFIVVISLLILGDVFVALSGAPIPGAVLGLVLFAASFALLGKPDEGAARLFDAIVPYAPMLFVPAAVGVVANLEIIASAWLSIVAAITLGSAITLVVTGRVLQFMLRARDPGYIPAP
jgi:holin-like protein